MPANPQAPADALRSLDEAFDQADLPRIRKELPPLERSHAADPRVRTFRARLTAADGDLDRGITLLRDVVKSSPEAHEARAYLGALLVHRKEYEEGVEHITAAMEKGADVPAANHAMGIALSAVGKFEDALHFLGRAGEAMPGSASTFFYLGICYAELGEWLNADANFVQSLRLEPRQVDAWELLGRVRAQMEKPAEALDALDEGLRLNPDSERLRRLRTQILADFGRMDLAEKELLAMPPDRRTAEDEATLAIAALAGGRKPEALKHARRSVELDAKNWNHHYLLGTALEGVEPLDRKAVVSAYKQAIALGDPEGRAGTRLGFFLTEDAPGGDVKEAILVLQAARKRNGDHPGTLLNLALAYGRAKNPEPIPALCSAILQRDDATENVKEQARRLAALAEAGKL